MRRRERRRIDPPWETPSPFRSAGYARRTRRKKKKCGGLCTGEGGLPLKAKGARLPTKVRTGRDRRVTTGRRDLREASRVLCTGALTPDNGRKETLGGEKRGALGGRVLPGAKCL